MATMTTVPMDCLDCGAPIQVPVTLHGRTGTERDGVVLADVKIDIQAFRDQFAEHAMAEPQAHPTFVIRTDETE